MPFVFAKINPYMNEPLNNTGKTKHSEEKFLPQDKIEPLVKSIGALYRIPKDQQRQAAKTHVKDVGNAEELMKELEYYYNFRFLLDWEPRLYQEMQKAINQMIKAKNFAQASQYRKARKIEIEKFRQHVFEHAKEEAKENKGVYLPWANRILTIGSDNSSPLPHEEIHAMAEFKDGSNGFMSKNGQYKNVSEATTEILTLYHDKPSSPRQLYDEIKTGKIKASYQVRVIDLLACLILT